jgi:hypothetical protein
VADQHDEVVHRDELLQERGIGRVVPTGVVAQVEGDALDAGTPRQLPELLREVGGGPSVTL